MVDLIVAIDKNGGMGNNNVLPWHYPEELKIFNQKTIGRILIIGRKTADYLPELKGREIVVISKTNDMRIKNIYDIPKWEENVIICGGRQIYQLAFEQPDLVQTVHISVMKKEYECDTFFDKQWLNGFVAIESTEYDDFTHYVLKRTSDGEFQYLNTLKTIIYEGEERQGRNGLTVSTFKNDFKFDLRNGFPLLTTKKMFLRGIVEELLFFLKGETNTKLLEEKKINIWKGNTSREFLDNSGMPYRPEGSMGPMYGYQWRHFNASYDEMTGKPLSDSSGVDQLKNIINLIQTDPHSRRILMTSYNPEQSEQGVLYPCHSIILQFYVNGENLDMYAYSRSADMFLGVPFNIASYSLFLMIVAKITKKLPRFLHVTLGDSHIYVQHYEQVIEQIDRIPYKFPTVSIPGIDNIKDIENLTYSDFILENYQSHSAIKATMIA